LTIRGQRYKKRHPPGAGENGLNMANSPSAKKRVRQSERRTEVNRDRRSRIRTSVKKVEETIASGDKSAAQAALKDAQPEIMRGAAKGIVHKNTASRKISRLSARIKALA
jgi:small subunit ribosomal protein S20